MVAAWHHVSEFWRRQAGTGSGWRETPKAIKETGQSQDRRQDGWTQRVANRGRLASRKLGTRAPPAS
ncbi:hypothetical protein PAHAL_1G414100 [Panicum hallii]|uniref:Uncharacterized protein n=1 Tax=Panicum hallii TaxID=206008 RepID=A0A2T8KXY7_9POAL|nr:hypothetical protein PAHAL_1G414100 [Panicum hallii]